MPVKDPEKRRRCGRERDRRLAEERIAAGTCPKCGAAPPEADRRLCAECGERRRRADRARYAQAKAEGRLYGGKRAAASAVTMPGAPRSSVRSAASARPPRGAAAARPASTGATAGSASCGPCAAPKARVARAAIPRPMAPRAARPAPGCSRAARRAGLTPGRCTRVGAPGSCAPNAAPRPGTRPDASPARGAATCARPSIAGCPAWPARFTVIEIDTGVCHGSFDSEAEVAACLVFAKLGHDQVEIVSDTSAMTRYAAWS